jgi:hypothetical protein
MIQTRKEACDTLTSQSGVRGDGFCARAQIRFQRSDILHRALRWEKLSAEPKAEQCGWLKDKYGLSWQITPVVMRDLPGGNDKALIERWRVTFPRYETSPTTRQLQGKWESQSLRTMATSGGTAPPRHFRCSSLLPAPATGSPVLSIPDQPPELVQTQFRQRESRRRD